MSAFSFSNSTLLPFQQTTLTYTLTPAKKAILQPSATPSNYVFIIQVWNETTQIAYLGSNGYIWSDFSSQWPDRIDWGNRVNRNLIKTTVDSTDTITLTGLSFPLSGTFTFKLNYVNSSYQQILVDSTTVTINGSNSYNVYSTPLNELITYQIFNMTFQLNSTLNNYLNSNTSTNNKLNLFIQFFDTNNVLKGYIGPNGYIFSDFSAPDWWNGAGDATHINYNRVNIPYKSNHIYAFQNMQFLTSGNYIFKLMYYNGDANVPIQTLNVTFNLEAPCFNEGTEILMLKDSKEEYVPIQTLKRGDLVKSYKHGYRKIELIGKNKMKNNPEDFGQCMYRMKKTESNGLTQDLMLTGWHSILVDDLGDCKEENELYVTGMIEDKHLLLSSVSKDFEKVESYESFTIYHFCLENDGDDTRRYGVYANGILSETPSKEIYTQNMNLISF